MDRWQNKVAVVTGASSGIGAAVVEDFIAAGLLVVGLARRQQHVEKLKTELTAEQQKRLFAIKCDVSQQESVNEAFDWIEKNLGGIDILVNSAGCMVNGQLSTMDCQLIHNVLQTNIMGVIYCTQRAFKSMKERNFDGHVVLINSINGHRMPSFGKDMPFTNIYPSSKFAITAINEMYRQEFNAFGTKVKITSISPGVVDTDFLHKDLKARMQSSMLNPKDISQSILFAISRPPHVQIHELTIKPIGEFY